MIRSLIVISLVFSGLAGVSIAQDQKDQFEGSISVTVPANRVLQSIQIGVEFSENSEVFKEESHQAKEPNDVIQVGTKSVVTMKKNYKKRLRYKDSKMVESSAMFYMFQYATHLKSFVLHPMFYMKDGSFLKSGDTDPVFTLDILEVDKPGDIKGAVVKSFSNLQFSVGEKNEILVDHKVSPDRRIAIRLGIKKDLEKIHSLHIPVKKDGAFPGKYFNGYSDEPELFYQASVAFVFSSRSKENGNMGMHHYQWLTDSINQYVRNHPDSDTKKIIEIPLRLKMKLAPEGAEGKKRVILGPKPLPEKKEKSRGLFGF